MTPAIRSISSALLLTLPAIAATSCASPVDRGSRAYEHGDYTTALREWRPLAEQGDPDACFLLGVLYDQGNGVDVDAAEAATWYRVAAVHGLAPAQNNLGLLSYLGRGVPKSYDDAAFWYELAAEQGFAGARNNLGVMYLLGQGVAKDAERAEELFRLAAAQGDAKARHTLDAVLPTLRDGGSDRNDILLANAIRSAR